MRSERSFLPARHNTGLLEGKGADVLSSHISVISIPFSAPQAQIRVLEINCWDCWLLIFFFSVMFSIPQQKDSCLCDYSDNISNNQ